MSRVVEFGVVFDCDGVLVNTEELGWQVWRSLAGDYGIELTLGDLRAITGCTDEESVSYFGKWLDERALVELGTRFAAAFAAARREELSSYPDAEETLRELRARGIPVVVASNSMTGDVEAALARTGLATGWSTRSSGRIRWRLLSRLRTCTERAAARLARDVVVAVEDSPAGIASARAAGLPVLAVDRGAFDPASLVEATVVAPVVSYSQLEALAGA